MGKIRILSGAEICHVLERHGFVAVRQKGSHRIMQKKADATTTTVPVPLHDSVRRGTLLSIIRQSNLPRAIFEASK